MRDHARRQEPQDRGLPGRHCTVFNLESRMRMASVSLRALRAKRLRNARFARQLRPSGATRSYCTAESGAWRAALAHLARPSNLRFPGRSCPGCGAAAPIASLMCNSCSRVLPTPHIKSVPLFKLFGLCVERGGSAFPLRSSVARHREESFVVDAAKLESSYKRLQLQVHPDRFAGATEVRARSCGGRSAPC